MLLGKVIAPKVTGVTGTYCFSDFLPLLFRRITNLEKLWAYANLQHYRRHIAGVQKKNSIDGNETVNCTK
jgi:hypothetical protein